MFAGCCASVVLSWEGPASALAGGSLEAMVVGEVWMEDQRVDDLYTETGDIHEW